MQSARDTTVVEEEIGSGSSRSLAQPEMSPRAPSRFWTIAAVGYSESVISLPSEVTSGSLLGLLNYPWVFKFASTLRSWLCSHAQSVSSLSNDLNRCGPSSTLAMTSWLSVTGRLFVEKSCRCFVFHAANLPSYAILRRFQELCHSTRRACLHERLPVQSMLPVDLICSSEIRESRDLARLISIF